MSRLFITVSVVGLFVVVTLAGPVPKDPAPKATDKNTNAVMKAQKATGTFSASSTWDNWPIDNLFDENEDTSWYSQNGDSPGTGQATWVQVTFANDVSIRRMTILGNRDPQYKNSYLVFEGKFQLLDAADKVIETKELKGSDEKYDFDWILKSKTKVRSIKFIATKDQGSGCVGLTEMMVE
jgi:hypothetical protein